MLSSRSAVASSFTVIKGAMVEETYQTFATWDFDRSKTENLANLRQVNAIGARSTTWLRDIALVLNRRFDAERRDRALIVLAQRGCDLEIWKPLLLWHITRDEFLLRDFLVNWFFPAYLAGAFRVRPEDLYDHLRTVRDRGGVIEHDWSESTLHRVAAGLLKMAADFGLVRGTAVKELVSYHLPDPSFIYVLHTLYGTQPSVRRVIEAPDWGMFLMCPSAVEREILRLHQFRKLHYEVAGSLAQLSLPCATALDYAEQMMT
jgi:hypothetical protein